MSHDTVICVYAKPPLPGRTKLRLAAAIGAEAAAQLARAMLTDLCRVVLQVAEARPMLWRPPDTAAADFDGSVPAAFEHAVQSGPDLGARMANTFDSLLSQPAITRALIVGADCITQTADTLRQAVAALEHADVVLQPARDGGYVLVGQRQLCREMFDQVAWGSELVMDQTRARLAAADIGWTELPATFDLDTVADLPMLRLYLADRVGYCTRAWIGDFDRI